MKPGGVVIASATVAPDFAIELGKRVEAAGLQMLDAPVSGGAARAASGEMTMMTSGPAAAYAACEDVLAKMAGQGLSPRLGAWRGIESEDHQPVARRCAYRGGGGGGWRSACAKASIPTRCTTSSRTARAIRGCSKTACRTYSMAITRRCRPSIFS